MKKEIISSAISQILILAFNFFSYKLILLFFGKNAFLDFSLIKRFLTFLYPLSTLGMGVAIPKFVSYYKKDITKVYLVVLTASLIVFVFNILIITFLYLFKDVFSLYILKNQNFSRYIVPVSCMIISYSLFILQIGLFRGLYKITVANLLQIIFLVILPLVFIFITPNFFSYLLLTAFTSILFGIGFLVFFYIKIFKKIKILKEEFIKFSKKLFSYGIQRIIADVGLSLIFLLPVILYSSQYGYEKGGYFAFAMSLFSLIGMVFSPLNFVILPKVTILLSENKVHLIKKYFYKILIVCFLYSFIIIFLFYLFGSKFLEIYIGSLSGGVYTILKNLIWGAFGYVIFVALRGIIDALYNKGINSMIILLSLIFIIIFSYFKIYKFLFIGFIVMGVLSIISIYIKLNEE